MLFVGAASGGGEQLFSSDGTAAGTTALTVPTAPATWNNIQSLTGFDYGQKAVFAAPDGSGNQQLWVTDGTGGGTTQVPVAVASGGLNPSDLTPFGGMVLFDADTGGVVNEWVTDGTGTNTTELTVPGASTSATTGYGFFAFTPFTQGEQPITSFALFEAQGTAAGTKNLYVTDGTSIGTHLVSLTLANTADIGPDDFISVGGLALFDGNGTAADVPIAISMSGTVAAANTLTVSGLASVASFAADDGDAAVLADHAFFTGTTTAGDLSLWETDGTAADTSEVAGFAATTDAPAGMNPSDETVVGSDIAFVGVDASGNNQVYLYDGSTATTITIPGGGWSLPAFAKDAPADLQGLGNTLLFTAVNSSGTLEHWSYNVATATGSEIPLADNAVAPSYPVAATLADVPSTPLAIMYLPDAHSPDNGVSYDLALWATDGTTAGTFELFPPGYSYDLEPVAQATDSDGNAAFVKVGTRVIFGAQTSSSGFHLFSTDGTSAGTVALPASGDIISNMVAIGDRAVFNDYTLGGLNQGLWVTDGTPNGTTELTVTGASSNGLNPQQITAFGTSWLFYGADTVGFSHPWITDGTGPGTTELSTTATDVGSITPIAGGTAVFSADTGSGPPENLWVTDGTPGGTQAVPGLGTLDTANSSFGADFVAWNGVAAFYAQQFGAGAGIWTTDGTQSGTKEIPGSSLIGKPVGVVNGKLLTEVGSPTNVLYSTDGTMPGTSLLADVELTTGFTPVGDSGEELFGGVGASGKNQLWITDGTPAGTTEFTVGNASTLDGLSPQDLTSFGSSVLFQGTDAAGYSGLWQTDGTPQGTTMIQVTGANPGIDTGLTDITELVACFAEGTRILTLRGETAVESLRIGDLVVSAQGPVRPVRWLGHRRIDCRRHERPRDVWPVRVRAGAFGPGRPFRDLLLSPDHAVFVDGLLIPIRYLMNGASVAQENCDDITYWHVELDRHDVLLAEGLPAESYLDTGNRRLLHFVFERLDLGVAEPEMMRDLVHHNVAHQPI